jgi:hypothetical protein
MNILIIPEDFRSDQYLLKPLFERLFADFGRPQTVRVCQNPRLRGVQEALNIERLREIVAMYPMVDIIILCVDRDGVIGRRTRLDEIEKELTNPRIFVAENAWEEIETWTLAGLDLPSDWLWSKVRAEISVKEQYFLPLARRLGVSDGPGGGRRALGERASRRVRAIRQKCPEDFGNLANRLERLLVDA